MLIAGVALGAGQEAAVAHPEFAPMQRGVDAGTLGAPLWVGYAVGLLIIAMMWVTCSIGFRAGHWIRIAVGAWTVSYIFAYVILLRTFSAYQRGETVLVAGFTESAAWLVFGIGLWPWILLLIITYCFKQAYFGPEDQARFDQILAGADTASVDRDSEGEDA